ncbi:DUF2059 domain-containing protein [Shimia ponticola]|uniref:DUF2059 domain-containing protein n=1 Tax=Shimia ponticola TaxID=2582893 RepID=UPI0011BE9628|nr:DUF2059 domain-containing protein [Shimia ponticola]
MTFLRSIVTTGVLAASLLVAGAATAADRAKLEAFMAVTGFDVALDSLRLSAGQAPALLGLSEENFGSDWTRLADEVFASEGLRADALDILEQTMDDEMLNHAADFYASELGQRLVEAENTAHMDDSADSDLAGQAIAAQLIEEGSPRIEYFQQMSAAIGSIENSIRAINEVQVRFLMAASAAGLTQRELDEAELRAILNNRADEMREAMQIGSVTNAAFTYRDFSDADMKAYLDALQQPLMQRVYELMNAVQFQLQIDRFEILAARMVELYPQQDI